MRQFSFITSQVNFLWCTEGIDDKFRDFNALNITRE